MTRELIAHDHRHVRSRADSGTMVRHFRSYPTMRPALLIASLLLIAAAHFTDAASAATPALNTEAERSGYARTGRYDEVIALCDAFARRYPDRVRCIDFGTTPEGRPMKALIASDSGALSAEAARAAGVPVVLIQGGIHAGEIDGKDAGFLALRQVLEGQAARGALDKLVLMFVPVFNIDGHERFGAWNRPNQNGPAEMGWRTTAQNYNLNRDYAKADTPEMQAMLALVNAWDPIATIDLHVTKLAAEQLCYLYHVNHGVPTTSLRYFTVYGPRQRPDMAFNRFLRAALDGLPITLYGDGEQTRDFTFVTDAVAATMAAGDRGRLGRAYNVGGGSRVSVNHVLEIIAGLAGRSLDVRREASQKGDMRDTYADTTLARADLGFAPKVSLAEGIEAEYRWLSSTAALA